MVRMGSVSSYDDEKNGLTNSIQSSGKVKEEEDGREIPISD